MKTEFVLQDELIPSSNFEPITTLGHGAFFGVDGKEFIPDAARIEETQLYYISTLKNSMAESINQEKLCEAEDIEQLIFSEVKDKTLANGLFIDWLLEWSDINNGAHLTMVNNALR